MSKINTPKTLQIFKAGTFTAMDGQTYSFSEEQLSASAKAYDTTLHEAPIVVGHPSNDASAPAYGWISSLSLKDGALEAKANQVDLQFAEMVKAGSYKKISASFYSPQAPSNPVPGIFYLRHVGFLGAEPPAVKGLRSPAFAEKEEGVIEFSEYDDATNASLWRMLREYLIADKGLEVADKVVPGYMVAQLEQSAQLEISQENAEFSEVNNEVNKMDEKEVQALVAANQALQAQLSQAEADRVAILNQQNLAAHVAFCEGLAKESKLPAASVAVLAQTLQHLSPAQVPGKNVQVIEFSEGNTKLPLADALKKVLSQLPAQVSFKEVATSATQASNTNVVNFAAPNGYSVDAERANLHAKALAYMTQHKVDYVSAINALST